MIDPQLIAALIEPKQAMLLGGLMLAIALVMAGTRRRMQTRSAARPSERDRAAELRERQGARDDMQELTLQLEELSRRIGAQIDTRFAKLETVIADADERIARLEAALRAARGVPALDITVGESARPTASKPVPVKPPVPPADVDPQRARIHRLSDEGKTPVEIARITGVKPGEVELILALRPGADGA